jgi:uncharacterized protein involved in outer membrane biogenesis
VPSSKHRLSLIVAGIGMLIGATLVVCEALGWPFLVGPLQTKLASALDRNVQLGGTRHEVQIRLFGSVRVRADRIEIGPPAWSSTAHTFLATDVLLRLTYGDLWRVYRKGALRIDRLEAETFDTQLERLADGRASWEFKPHQPSAAGSVTDLPNFGELRVASGTVTLNDRKTPMDVEARYSLSDGTRDSRSPVIAASAPDSGASSPITRGLQLSATGHYKRSPLRIAAETDGVLILEGRGGASSRQPLRIDAIVGTAQIAFMGAVEDPLHLTGLQGQFKVAGPSLDAAGEPLGVTFPVTPPFDATGTLVKDGLLWKAVVDRADIGSSKLRGAFVFDKRGKVALLAGKLMGRRLALSDLGPAIGHAKAIAGAPIPASARAGGRVIPDHAFDLPSLRVMNANVLFDIEDLDLGTSALEPFRPARAHLTLNDGLLSLQELYARTGQGELSGALTLDGRQSPAIYTTDLRVRGVELAHWLHQKRGDGDPPYLSGRLDGQLKVTGRGRSVAEILAGLNGDARFHLRDAAVSHLALKAAGLDVAGGVRVLLSGDKPLEVHCNVADLSIASGVVRPRVFVVSLDNATIWATGRVSLKDETLDVKTVSSPKDFSPFTLRTPINIKGTLSKPAISVQAAPLVQRAGAAVLLGLLNPLAAIVPFLDPGAREAARQEDRDCAALARKAGSR